jgi:hypothetical protein
MSHFLPQEYLYTWKRQVSMQSHNVAPGRTEAQQKKAPAIFRTLPDGLLGGRLPSIRENGT